MPGRGKERDKQMLMHGKQHTKKKRLSGKKLYS